MRVVGEEQVPPRLIARTAERSSGRVAYAQPKQCVELERASVRGTSAVVRPEGRLQPLELMSGAS